MALYDCHLSSRLSRPCFSRVVDATVMMRTYLAMKVSDGGRPPTESDVAQHEADVVDQMNNVLTTFNNDIIDIISYLSTHDYGKHDYGNLHRSS